MSSPYPETVLNWSSREHTLTRPRPCRHCGGDTLLKDAEGKAGKPSHKVCAERAAERKAASPRRHPDRLLEVAS